VVEVIPRVRLDLLSGAGTVFGGLARHRGESIPVIDLGQLLSGIPCSDQWSSRIVVVEISDGGKARRFGLMAEQIEPVTFANGPKTAMEAEGLGNWGRICEDSVGVFQMLDLELVYSRIIRNSLQGRSDSVRQFAHNPMSSPFQGFVPQSNFGTAGDFGKSGAG
jgi:chemotaxis signal transduction protein